MSHDPNECQKCRRVGLPILLTRPSVYDNTRFANLVEALPAGFDKGSDLHRVETARPVLRTLRGGWLYVFYEKYKANAEKRWKIFAVSADGFLTEVSQPVYGAVAAEHDTSKAFTCSAAAANFHPRFLVIQDAGHVGSIGLAFSEHPWTPDLLNQYAGDDAKRAARFQQMDVTRWLKSAPKPPADCAPLTSGFLKRHVAEYQLRDKEEKLKEAFAHSGYHFAANLGQADALDAAARAVEQAQNLPMCGLVLMLRDPVGLTGEFNTLRQSAAKSKLEWLAGGPTVDGKIDPDRAWKCQSSDLIEKAEGLVEATYAARKRETLSKGVYMTGTEYSVRSLAGKIPKGTQVEMMPAVIGAQEVMYKVTYPAAEIERRAKKSGRDRLSRLRERYNIEQCARFRHDTIDQDRAWEKHIALLDLDWVKGMQGQWARLTHLSQYELDARVASHVLNWRPRYAATMFGGTGLSDYSRNWYARHLALDPSRPEAWIPHGLSLASAGPGQELLKQLTNPDSAAGTGGKIYDVLKGVLGSFEEVKKAKLDFNEALTHKGVGTAIQQSRQAVDTLLSTTGSVLTQMRNAALVQQPYAGLTYTMQAVENLHLRYVRMSLMHMTLQSGKAWYSAVVRTQIHESLNWVYEAAQYTSAVEFNSLKDVGKHRTSSHNSHSQRVQQGKTSVRVQPIPGGHSIEMVTLVTEDIKVSSSHTHTYSVTSGGPMGSAQQSPVKVGVTEATKLVQKPTLLTRSALAQAMATDKGTYLAGGVLIFQTWAIYTTLKQIGSKGGLDRVDAALSLTSSVAGFAAACAEIWAMALEKRAGELTARANRWKFRVGVLSVLAAWVDAVAAGIKAYSQYKQGNTAAGNAYLVGGVGFASAGFFGGSGAWLAYVANGGQFGSRAGLAVGRAVATRVVAGTATSAAATGLASVGAGVAASWLTGIGLVITIVAVGVMIYGAMIEDDDAEKFLRRTRFGKPGDDNKPFASLEEEVSAFNTLSYGVRIEHVWSDGLFDWLGGSNNTIETKIMLGYFDPQHSVLDYHLQFVGAGHSKVVAQGLVPQQAITAPMEGGLQSLSGSNALKYLDMKSEVAIDSDKYHSAILTYNFWPEGKAGPVIKATMKVTDDT